MTAPVLMQIDKVAVAEVAAHDRLRPISEAGVESLIASITELGVMKDAIHVRKRRDGQLTLIAGGHRLEAARRLGWEDLPAKVWTGVTDDWARLMEIDDNLAGAEMCALDNAIFLAQRKIIYERLHPDVKKGGDRKSPNFKNLTDTMSVRSFAAATAEKFGLSDRHVFRMIAAGTALDAAEITRLRAAPQSVSLADLQAISKVTSAAERAHVVDALAAGSAKSAAAARAQPIRTVLSPVLKTRLKRRLTRFPAFGPARQWRQSGGLPVNMPARSQPCCLWCRRLQNDHAKTSLVDSARGRGQRSARPAIDPARRRSDHQARALARPTRFGAAQGRAGRWLGIQLETAAQPGAAPAFASGDGRQNASGAWPG
jgi:ParB family chromosome partitioning protein